ncbi:hypothetical protein DA2_3852 [Desulfovibrio sp. A2]|nr:hypothetical protein DA2_3852 [Desulfovibrio sp. A2]
MTALLRTTTRPQQSSAAINAASNGGLAHSDALRSPAAVRGPILRAAREAHGG